MLKQAKSCMSKLIRMSHHKLSSSETLPSSPSSLPKRWNLSILEYAVGWPLWFMQLAQDFTWLGRNSSEHACLPNGQRSGCSKAGWSTHCTVHTRALHAPWLLPLWPNDHLSLLLCVQCTVVAGRPVTSAPSAHAAVPLGVGFPAVCSHRPHRHQSHTQTGMSKRKRVFIRFFCLHAPASSYCVRDDTVYAWPRVTHTTN